LLLTPTTLDPSKTWQRARFNAAPFAVSERNLAERQALIWVPTAEPDMSKRNRISTALFVGATAAILTLAMPVVAQVPAQVAPNDGTTPASAPAMKPADTVNLTMEQKHVIKEIILKDLKVAEPTDQAAAAKVPTEVGQTVPAGIPLQPMPVEVSAKVPQLKAHSFLVKNDKVIVIDPKDNKVAALIE